MSVIGSKYRGTQAYHFVHCRLITAAQRREELRYADIVSILGIATTGHHMAREVGQVLGEISEDEHDAGRPMLSALVVSAVTQSPGSGFYTLARQLGLLAADDPMAEMRFWTAEEGKVWDAWQLVTASHQ